MPLKAISRLALIAGFLALLMPAALYAEGFCGDGALQPPEECDDGNLKSGDGCSPRCMIEDIQPPTLTSVSIPNGTQNVATTTRVFTVVFSEPIDPNSLNTINNVILMHDGKPMDITLNLAADQKTLTITAKDDLFPNSEHALRIKYVKDLAGNAMKTESIIVFTTGDLIDRTPPNVVLTPPAGKYNFPQNVELTPYIGAYTGSPDFIDKTAKIYYTIDNSDPTFQSPLYDLPIPIRTNTTLKYFAVDAIKNRTQSQTAVYTFACPDMPHSKKSTQYPRCVILECEHGFVLRGNSCVTSLETVDPDDYKTNAVTAPLFGSSVPVTITSKPSIYITPEHKGIIPRPLIFKDLKRKTIVQFERDTKILDMEGKAFSGYLKPPVNLYMKDFPTNFGYTFRSIFEFKAADGRDLTFSPPFHITVPYTDAFNPDEGVTLFTYDPKTEAYTAYDPTLYSFDLAKQQATFTSAKTGIFFIAQSGSNFNRSIFTDIQGHWAKNYIEALYRRGVVKGKDNGIFAPDDLLTRAEFITIALKAASIEIPTADAVVSAPFRDAPLDAWFTPAIAKAKEIGLIKGYPGNTIRPQQLINRAEAVKILLTAFQFDLAPKKGEVAAATLKDFKDLVSNVWYSDFIDFALRHKLVNGLANKIATAPKKFGPDRTMTRAEMAKLTEKTIELKETMDKAK